jgi:hypothetical protein
MGGRIIEVTFLLVLTYLVVANAGGFSIAISALANAYSSAVKTLQAR